MKALYIMLLTLLARPTLALDCPQEHLQRYHKLRNLFIFLYFHTGFLPPLIDRCERKESMIIYAACKSVNPFQEDQPISVQLEEAPPSKFSDNRYGFAIRFNTPRLL